jgi:hypothetical protein
MVAHGVGGDLMLLLGRMGLVFGKISEGVGGALWIY